MVTERTPREEQRQAKLDALREDIRKGVESGPGIPANQVFDRLERKYGRNHE
jgi:antitoxin ParD1/3/4